jgi:hypothetical protein
MSRRIVMALAAPVLAITFAMVVSALMLALTLAPTTARATSST